MLGRLGVVDNKSRSGHAGCSRSVWDQGRDHAESRRATGGGRSGRAIRIRRSSTSCTGTISGRPVGGLDSAAGAPLPKRAAQWPAAPTNSSLPAGRQYHRHRCRCAPARTQVRRHTLSNFLTDLGGCGDCSDVLHVITARPRASTLIDYARRRALFGSRETFLDRQRWQSLGWAPTENAVRWWQLPRSPSCIPMHSPSGEKTQHVRCQTLSICQAIMPVAVALPLTSIRTGLSAVRRC